MQAEMHTAQNLIGPLSSKKESDLGLNCLHKNNSIVSKQLIMEIDYD